MKRTSVLLVCLLAVGGCSSGADQATPATSTVVVTQTQTVGPTSATATITPPTTPTITPQATTAVEPEPLPTVMSTEAAGALYLKLVKPHNAAAATFYGKTECVPDVGPPSRSCFRTLRALAKRYADAQRVFSAALLSNQSWPYEAQEDIRALGRSVASGQRAWRNVALADDPQAFIDAVNVTPDDTGEAEVVRQLLGLPERE